MTTFQYVLIAIITYLIALVLFIMEAPAMESDLGKWEVLRVDHCELPLCENPNHRRSAFVTIPYGSQCNTLTGLILGITWVKSNFPSHVLFNAQCVTFNEDDV